MNSLKEIESVFNALRPNKKAHSLQVANTAKHIADALKCNGKNVSPDAAYSCGLYHDIGYVVCQKNHGYFGHQILSVCGFEKESLVALFHSGSEKFVADDEWRIWATYENGRKKLTREIQLLIDIVTYADLTTNSDGRVVTLSERLADVSNRYGLESLHAKIVQEEQKRIQYITTARCAI